jgi:putative transposase
MTKRRKRHGPEEIVRKLRDADAMLNAGKDVVGVLQALEISEATYLRRRNHYGGMEAEEAKRLKLLEEENKRLKELVAEQHDFALLEGRQQRSKQRQLSRLFTAIRTDRRLPHSAGRETQDHENSRGRKATSSFLVARGAEHSRRFPPCRAWRQCCRRPAGHGVRSNATPPEPGSTARVP